MTSVYLFNPRESETCARLYTSKSFSGQVSPVRFAFKVLVYLIREHGNEQVVFVVRHFYELVGIDFPPRRIVFDFYLFQSARLPVDFLLQEK